MTDPERVALDHIRQVVDSVIGVPVPPEPPSAGMNVSILPVPMAALLRDGAGKFTKDAGAAAGIMLVRAFVDEAFNPADFYTQTNASGEEVLSFTQIMDALGANGVPVELRSNLELSDLALILFSGRPVVAPIQQSVFQQAGLTQEKFEGTYYVVVVGMDVRHVIILDPLRKDAPSQVQAVSWSIFYEAWSQAQGYIRAVLVPHQQLIRRVRVSSNLLDVFEQPGGADATPAGTASFGEVFEVTIQKNGWGKIGEDRWINLSYTADI
jgi:hypothetical protein